MHWVLAFPLLAFGLIALLLNLSVAFTFIRDCLRTGRFKRRSGLPFLGPLLLSLGWWVSPIPARPWMFWLLWGLDLSALLASYVVLHATRSKPA